MSVAHTQAITSFNYKTHSSTMISLKKILSVVLLSIFLIPSAYSQPVESKKQTQIQSKESHDYALLVRKVNHLKAALKTVTMMKDDGKTINHFEVVMCGKGVTQLNDNTDLISKATQSGITLSACGMSLNKFAIEEDELPKGVGIVPNGLIRIFDLQQQGYQTIAL
jgi:intracellular sulfur oxidation DsrE/DsrF family protein